MKKTLLTLAMVLFALAAQAQFKIHSDSHVSIGTLSGSWDKGTQLYPSGRVFFNTQDSIDWHWVTVATPGCAKGKCWIVTAPNDKYDHRFFVSGNGYVFKRGNYKASDASLQSDTTSIVDASAILDSITGTWYIPYDEEGNGTKEEIKRRAGVTAQDVERVLPEAVTADDKGLLYVDYDVLTVFLIEAFKEQRQEIRLLRKTLEENGLIEPGKP